MLEIPGRGYPAYVGVTGFVGKHELPDVLSAIQMQDDPDLRAGGDILFAVDYPSTCPVYQLQAGFLVNGDTVRNMQAKKPYRYPHPAYLRELLYEANYMDANIGSPWFPVIHFNEQDQSRLVYVMQRLEEIVNRGRLNFQINFSWPAVVDLEYFARYEEHGRRRIILQIGAGALQIVEMDPQKLIEALKGYGDSITDILLDPSGGHGIEADFESLRPLVARVYVEMPYLGVGVAGGLCAESVPRVSSLLTEFPGLSVDAENNVRLPATSPRTNVIDITAVANYVGAFVKTVRAAARSSYYK